MKRLIKQLSSALDGAGTTRNRRGGVARGPLAAVAAMLAALVLLAAPAGRVSAAEKPPKDDKKAAAKAPKGSAVPLNVPEKTWLHVTPEAVQAEVRQIYAMGPRAVGQTGHRKVRDYVRGELKKLKLDVFEQRFHATVPLDIAPDGSDRAAVLSVGGGPAARTFRVAAVWPNGPVPSYAGETVSRSGDRQERKPMVSGKLIDGGDGSLTALDGKDIEGNVVVLDFNSGKNWEDVAKLGARSILFRPANAGTTSQEATRKFFLVPVQMPRFLLSPEDAAAVDALLKAGNGVAGEATIVGGARWENVEAGNIMAYIEGKDPKQKEHVIVVLSYLDAMSVAPAAHDGKANGSVQGYGADTSLQLVAALNVARGLTADPSTAPGCSVLLVFTDAQHALQQGARELGYIFSRFKRDERDGGRNVLAGAGNPRSLAHDAKVARDQTIALRDAVTFLAGGGAGSLSSGAQEKILDRIGTEALRCKMVVASEIQQIQQQGETALMRPELDAKLVFLKGLRDWLNDTDGETDPAIKIARVVAGPAQGPEGRRADEKSPWFAHYRLRDVYLDSKMIHERLATLSGDFDRAADMAENYAEVGRRILQGHQTGRFTGLYLELAPGADQVTWHATHHMAFSSNAQRTVFRSMLAQQAPVAAQLAEQMKLRQAEPLGDAFSLEGTATRGNRGAPSVPAGNFLAGAGFTSYGLLSMNADRQYLDTPVDTPETIDFAKAGESMRFITGWVAYLSTEPNTLISAEAAKAPKMVNISGRVVKYDILAGVSPNQPVPGALVYFPLPFANDSVGKEGTRTVAGVRYAMVQKVGQLGRFSLRSVPDKTAKSTKKDMPLYGFRIDEETGLIEYALDSSSQGTELLSNRATRVADESVSVVVAKLRGVTLYDMMDPRTLMPFNEIQLLGASTLNKLQNFSIYLNKQHAEEDSGPFLENCGVVFVPPVGPFVGMVHSGYEGVRAAYLNLEPAGETAGGVAKVERKGYNPAGLTQIDRTAFRAAQDMVRLNEQRLGTFRRWGIRNKMLDELHKESSDALEAARQAFERKKYSDGYKESEHAWGVAVRAYEPIRAMGKDAVIGSVFFMALVLPFAFFMERLTVRAKNPNMRVVGTLAWFLAIFGLMFWVHPAFSISLSPMIVLLAFVMLVLVAVVASIIYRKFVNLVRQYRNQLEGVHGADLKRFSAGGVALNLSLSTMARRKARTLLTGATLTMLAFAIVTFSSITTSIKYDKTVIAGVTPPYTGLMFRMPDWYNMPVSVVESFRNEFGDNSTVLPRAWKMRSQDPWNVGIASNNTMLVKREFAAPAPTTAPVAVPVPAPAGSQAAPAATEAAPATASTAPAATATKPPKAARPKARVLNSDIVGIVGLTPEETQVLPINDILETGRWLSGANDEAIISARTARQLKITPEEVAAGTAFVTITEQRFRVVGILKKADPSAPDEDSDNWRMKLDDYTDLDGESFAPVDFAAAGVDGRGRGVELNNLPPLDASRRMPHLSYNKLVILPLERTLRMTDTVTKAVAVKFGPEVDAKAALERLTQRLKIPVFAGTRDAAGKPQAVLMQAVDSSGLAGITKLIVPIALAVFMIVNTLLGTVEERKDEIAMLNSVGLAPAHVGMLFLVEAVVYGVIGLVVGYLAGLILAKVILGVLGGASGVSLNYSSGATIISSVFVLVIVVLSAAYPARQAKKMATPGTMARWVLPESDDGSISIEVPFTLTGGNAIGMIGFLDEYIGQHTEATSPDFRIMHKHMAEVPDSYEVGGVKRPELELAGDAYLAPYDLGVSNTFKVLLRATDQPNIFRVRFAISRLGGDMNSYRRATQRFLDLLRRQFLIWRTLEPSEKQKYVTRALAGFAGDRAAAEAHATAAQFSGTTAFKASQQPQG